MSEETLAFNIIGRDRSASATFNKVARAADDVNSVMAKSKKTTDALVQSDAKLTSARNSQADAVGKVRVAEAKLSEVRDKLDAKTSQIVAAEERLSQARRKAAEASADVVRVSAEAMERSKKQIGDSSESAGKESGRRFGAGFRKWLTGDGKNIFKQVGEDGGTVFGSGFLGALKTPVLGPAIVGSLGVAVATVMPAVGAIAAGGLAAGFGAGLSALGIVFAAKSVAIKNRWLKMLHEMGAELTVLSSPFETTLTKMSGIVKRTFNRFAPELKASFKTIAPALTQFGDELGRAFEGLAPAIQPLSQAFTEVLKSLGPAMKDAISNISTGLTDLAESVKKSPDGLADLVKGAGAVTRQLTGFITTLNNVNGAFEKFTGGFSLVDATFKGLGVAIAGVTGPFWLLQKAMSAVGIKTAEVDKSMDMSADTTKLWTQGLTDAQAKTASLGGAVTAAGPKVESLTTKFERQAAATDKLITSMFRLQNLALALSGAQIGMREAVANATQAIKDNGKHLSILTEKGRANQTALNNVAKAANDQTEAMIRSNKSQVAVAIAAGKSRQSFIALAVQMGATRPAAIAMAKQLIAIPNVTRRAILTANKQDLDAKLAAAKKQLADKNLTKDRKAQLKAEISQLEKAVRQAKGALASLPTSKTISITTNLYKNMIETTIARGGSGVRLPGRERGGPVVKGQPYIVGEKKAEVFVPDHNGTIYPEVPSRGLGGSVAAGMAAGITGGAGAAMSAAASLANAVIDKARQVLGIASPSKQFTKLGIFVNQGFAQGLRGSAKQVQTVMKQLVGKLIDLSYSVGSSKSKAINRVLAGLGRESKALQGLAAQRLKVAGQLKAAQAKLAAVLKERNEFAASIRDAALSFNAITNIQAPEDRELVAGDVLSRMRETLAKTRDFASKLARLKATGLGPVLYRQIAEAGVEQGSTLAEALLSGGKGAINEANNLQTQIIKASAGLGNTAANNLYQAGVDGAQGLVNGLLAKTKALDAASKKLAQQIVASIKHQLGIKSPSRVMRQMGVHTGRGFQLGIESTYDAVKKAGLGLGASVQPGSRSYSGGGSSGQSVTVQLVLDGRVIQQSLLKMKQGNGGAELGLA